MVITVIGLGQVGIETFKELCKRGEDIFGVDIDEELIENLRKLSYNVGQEVPISEAYIICVYATDQVIDVINKINKSNNPLIIIESTVASGTYKKLKKDNFGLVLFPHRFNPNDSEHHVFNLDRVMGGNEEDLKRALEFYKQFMDERLIHMIDPEIAELVKPLENAYRFVEIAIAEELKMLCDLKGLDFNKIRRACNTKWNIDIKEARDGIGGRCLPKDIEIIDNFFEKNDIFKTVINIDEKYKEDVAKKGW